MGEIQNEKCFTGKFFTLSLLASLGQVKTNMNIKMNKKKNIYYQNVEKNCVYFVYLKNVAVKMFKFGGTD